VSLFLVGLGMTGGNERTFLFNDAKLEYFKHDYNHAGENDRTIEIPIVRHYIETVFSKNLLEIGRVLPFYFADNFAFCPWDVLDKYSKGCINEDVVQYRPTTPYGLIISISTFEHIGYGESKYAGRKIEDDPEKVLRAARQVKHAMLLPFGLAILTMPIGFNKNADRLAFAGELFDRQYYFKRISADNCWRQVDKEDVLSCRFGWPYRWGNGLIVGEIDGAKQVGLS
jgi:hypothetical protein